jgi:choline kinase
MVPLAGYSLLSHLLRSLNQVGIDDVVVVAGYQAERIEAPNCRIIVNHDYLATNMVASMFCASSWMSGETDVLICYADTVFEPRVIRAVLLESEGDVVVASDDCWHELWARRMPDPLADAETFCATPAGFLLEVGRKPQSIEQVQGQYMGLFKVRHSALPALHRVYASLDRDICYEGRRFDEMFMTCFLQILVDRGWPIKVVRTCGGWLEVDSVSDLRFYEQCAATGTLDSICRLDTSERE